MIFFFFAITLLTTFTSCQKEKEQGWLPQVKEYFTYHAYLLPDNSKDSSITLTDGEIKYELHFLGNGIKYVKFVSGVPEEFIGEQLINQKAYELFEKKVHKNLLTSKDWKNWFYRNANEGFNYHVKSMGAFLLSANGNGTFAYTRQAFVCWSYGGPTTYWQNNLTDGIPSEWLPDTGAYRIEIFCSLPIMDND